MSSIGRHETPRYSSLRDYLRVLRHNRVLIVVIAAAFAAAAYVLTARQPKIYQAQAQVQFQDPSQQIDLLGTTVYPSLPDVTRAQINAGTLTRPAVVQKVKSELRSPLSLAALAAPISTFVNTQTNVVVIQASSRSPVEAQQLANAFAQAAKTVNARELRTHYASMAASVQRQFNRLPKSSVNNALSQSVYAERTSILQFLAQSANPVNILQSASLPTVPAGPRPVRNTLLGLLLGLTIALVIAFARDALDRRLRRSAEIGEHLGWPILGHVRSKVFGVPVFFTPNGKPLAEEADRESFRMLHQNVRFLNVDQVPRAVVVTSALPEEGKTTVAAALACAAAAGGTHTLLVECDLRRPSLADRLGVKRAPGLTDFLLGDAQPQDILRLIELPISTLSTSNGSPATNGTTGHVEESIRAVLGEAVRRLACITAGRAVPETAALLGSDRFRTFLTEVIQAYELVVLDAGPVLSVADTGVLLPSADATLVCVRADRTTRDEAAALKQAIERFPHGSVGIVVTGVPAGAEHDLGYYSYAYAYEAST